jgi:hypothetical protein
MHDRQKRITRTGAPDHGSQNWNARKEHPEQDSQTRTAKARQLGKETQERTTSSGHLGQDKAKTDGIGPRQDRQDRTAKTGQPGQDNHDMMLGQHRQNKTVRTRTKTGQPLRTGIHDIRTRIKQPELTNQNAAVRKG